MGFQLLDRAQMTVSGMPGTGTVTLGSAAAGYQTFAAAGLLDGDTTPYLIKDGSNWEFGVGTYIASGTLFKRTIVTMTSAGSASPLSLTSSAVVSATLRAEDVQADILSMDRRTGRLWSTKAEYASLAGGATATLVNYTGNAGYLSQLFIAIGSSSDAQVMDNAVINVYLDGSGSPSITMDAETFFNAVYAADYNVGNGPQFGGNKFFGYNESAVGSIAYYSRLPIPFNTGVKVTLTSGHTTSSTLWCNVAIHQNVANNWSRTRKLKITYNLLASPSANSIETLINDAPGKRGRYLGMYLMDDDTPGSLSPYGAALEGNFTLYLDLITATWAASTVMPAGAVILDPNGNVQTTSAGGTTGSSAPTWSRTGGGSTTDGSVTWTETPGAPNQVWLASAAFAVNMSIVDPNGYVQQVTTAGTSGSSAPTFNSTPGGTTTDGGVTWTNEGATHAQPSFQSSGTEDYFLMGFYAANLTSNQSLAAGEVGTTFFNASAGTRSFYRYHVSDPITFENSIALVWQVGDTSQKAWSSGTPKFWIVTYYYTE